MCPKFPTLQQLRNVVPSKNIFLEKTVDFTQEGYIGNRLDEFLSRAGTDAYGGIYFSDGFALQTVDM